MDMQGSAAEPMTENADHGSRTLPPTEQRFIYLSDTRKIAETISVIQNELRELEHIDGIDLCKAKLEIAALELVNTLKKMLAEREG